jgi:RHS repeat-associated protein
MKSTNPMADRLRALLAAPEGIELPGCYDVLSAMILEQSTFGKTRASGSISTPFRFAGQQEDPETGLHYNRYRYYDPEVGRYISPDPIGLTGGLNLYAYGPNPVAWIDPLGWVKHHMDVSEGPDDPENPNGPFNPASANTNPPNGSNPPTYISGITQPGGQPPCPSVTWPNGGTSTTLNTPGTCHTEGKFAADLMNQYGANGAQGKNFGLTGQLPPCPNCHAALTRAAQVTGAKVTYQWPKGANPMQSITYVGPGGSPTPGASNSSNTNTMLAAYNQQNMNQAGTGGTAQQAWGFTPGPNAWEQYRQNK